MSKMTDEQIKKALEVCSITNMALECKDCPYNTFNARYCSLKLYEDALDLINRQQAEIERLQVRLRKERHQFEDLGKMYSEIRAEVIKELEAKIHEKLHEAEMHGNFEPVVTRKMFDSVVEEMVGEGK